MPPTGSTMLTPAQRLLLSRQRLSQALHEAGLDEDERKSSNTPPDWISSAGTLSGASGFVLGAVRHWWQRLPLQHAGSLVNQTANAMARPVATKHPVALMAGAMALGAALVWTRPWRWLPGTALLATLAPTLLRAALHPRD
ncbi:MAG: hypothetical protein Q8R98_09850 [Rubrivivax sp.]|nr:hypothetical protein [Rubrivivax sp.]MDP3612144.1 hypothetical protein [Rubrivivax sp.]